MEEPPPPEGTGLHLFYDTQADFLDDKRLAAFRKLQGVTVPGLLNHYKALHAYAKRNNLPALEEVAPPLYFENRLQLFEHEEERPIGEFYISFRHRLIVSERILGRLKRELEKHIEFLGHKIRLFDEKLSKKDPDYPIDAKHKCKAAFY